MDLVLFKGNERRSGANFGQPESHIEFLAEASPVSESESEDSEEDSDEEDVALKNWVGPQADAYRQQREREKAAKVAYKRSCMYSSLVTYRYVLISPTVKQRAPQQLESPHALVVYPLNMRNTTESYRWTMDQQG